MARRKAQAKPVDLLDVNVVGPEDTHIDGGDQNMMQVARWWESVKLYEEAMRALDRVVLLGYDRDSDEWYVSSVPQMIEPRA